MISCCFSFFVFEQILRLGLNGPCNFAQDQEGNEVIQWPAHSDLEDASLLGFILPFIQYVRRVERGSLTMDTARKTTIRSWIASKRSMAEKNEARGLYRSFEAAWNKAFGIEGLRNGCRQVQLPEMNDERPIAIACPMAKAPMVRGKEFLHIDEKGTAPEWAVAIALHELATKHNKMLYVAAKYCQSDHARHVKYLVHQETSEGLEEDGSFGGKPEDAGSHLMIQKAGEGDLLLFSSDYSSQSSLSRARAGPNANADPNADNPPPPAIQANYRIDDLLFTRHIVSSNPNCPADAQFDLHDVENQLVYWLFASRRPLKVSSADHTEESLFADISPFPYLRDSDLSTLEAVVARQGPNFPEQQPLRKERGAADLEYRLLTDRVFAEYVVKLTGDLLSIYQSAKPEFLAGDCKTVADLVNKYEAVGDAFVGDENRDSFVNHPDSLSQVTDHPEIGQVPLSNLVSLYLTAREQIVLAEQPFALPGYDENAVFNLVKDCDTSAAPRIANGRMTQVAEKEGELDKVTRLIVRCLILSDKPMPREEIGDLEEKSPLLAMVGRVNVLDEVDDDKLYDYFPMELHHWNETSRGHTLAVFKMYRDKWVKEVKPEIERKHEAAKQASRQMAMGNNNSGTAATSTSTPEVTHKQGDNKGGRANPAKRTQAPFQKPQRPTGQRQGAQATHNRKNRVRV